MYEADPIKTPSYKTSSNLFNYYHYTRASRTAEPKPGSRVLAAGALQIRKMVTPTESYRHYTKRAKYTMRVDMGSNNQ